MYFLKDSYGNTVRAIQETTEKLFLVQRRDNSRIEFTSDLSFYKKNNICYLLINEINLNDHTHEYSKQINVDTKILYLVKSPDQILKNIELQKDDDQQFKTTLFKTSLVAFGSGLIIFILSLLFKNQLTPKEKLEVVQVMDRQQIEKIIMAPKEAKIKLSNERNTFVKNPIPKKMPLAKNNSTQSAGLLEALGSLNKSKQTGGLKLEQIQNSKGVGYSPDIS